MMFRDVSWGFIMLHVDGWLLISTLTFVWQLAVFFSNSACFGLQHRIDEDRRLKHSMFLRKIHSPGVLHPLTPQPTQHNWCWICLVRLFEQILRENTGGGVLWQTSGWVDKSIQMFLVAWTQIFSSHPSTIKFPMTEILWISKIHPVSSHLHTISNTSPPQKKRFGFTSTYPPNQNSPVSPRSSEIWALVVRRSIWSWVSPMATWGGTMRHPEGNLVVS